MLWHVTCLTQQVSIIFSSFLSSMSSHIDSKQPEHELVPSGFVAATHPQIMQLKNCTQ